DRDAGGEEVTTSGVQDHTHYFGDDCVPPHSPPVHTGDSARDWDSPPACTDLEWAEVLLGAYPGLVEADPHAEDTPRRFLTMLDELTSHKRCDGSCIKFRAFANDGMDEMIVVQDIPFVSVCSHH